MISREKRYLFIKPFIAKGTDIASLPQMYESKAAK